MRALRLRFWAEVCLILRRVSTTLPVHDLFTQQAAGTHDMARSIIRVEPSREIERQTSGRKGGGVPSRMYMYLGILPYGKSLSRCFALVAPKTSRSLKSSLREDHDATVHVLILNSGQGSTGIWNLKMLDYLGWEEKYSRGERGRAGFGGGLPFCNHDVPMRLKGRLFLF